MKETLLEKAKKGRSIRQPAKATLEECELVLAWLEGEINRSEVCFALGKASSMGVYKLTQIIRSMYQTGGIVKGGVNHGI